jgi:uncharacterized protein (DUF924 family)
VTPSALGIWLLADPIEHSQAMQDLVTSRDLLIAVDGDTFTVARAHNDIISRLKTGNFPLPLAALA